MVQPNLTKTVRYGQEATRGTGVTCTGILDIADAEWDIVPPTIRSDNLTGGVFPSSVLAAGVLIPRVKVKLGSINPDKWQKWLAGALDGSIAAAGAGADKTWGSNAIKPPAVSTGAAIAEALKSYTLEFGFANPSAAMPAHKITGAIIERIKLVWNRVGFVNAELDFVSIGSVTDLTAYSGTLSPDAAPTWTPDHSNFKAYVDDTTIGTTQDTTVVSAEPATRATAWPSSVSTLEAPSVTIRAASAALPSMTVRPFGEAATSSVRTTNCTSLAETTSAVSSTATPPTSQRTTTERPALWKPLKRA